ncbi:MAG: hypothetical protein CMO44_11465 [Verrucomicrobiales bacterium]|nr:hypothetical protein [Verrucomicrobiales bacterium]
MQSDLVEAAKVPELSLLKSKLVAYESEIENMTADKVLLDQDLTETKEALNKIKKELSLSISSAAALSKENSILKENFKKMDNEIKSLTEWKTEHSERAKMQEKNEKDFVARIGKLKEENESFCEEIRKCKNQAAKDIGKLRNIQMEKNNNLLREKAKLEHDYQSQIVELKATIANMNNDHKDIVTSQATRLRAYEHQLNILETRNNRLQMSIELQSKPKSHELEMEKKLEMLKLERQEHLKQMKDLEDRMSMARLNQHYDFRAKSII